MMPVHLLNGDVMAVPLADQSVHCIVTSPPYWGLRDYGTGKWVGGDAECDHKPSQEWIDHNFNANGFGDSHKHQSAAAVSRWYTKGKTCPKCGAQRIDKQLGSESLHDCGGWVTGDNCGECFVCHVRQYAREFWRVLRDDGTWWLNLGDSYANNGVKDLSKVGGFTGDRIRRGVKGTMDSRPRKIPDTLKPKDLCGIPWRVALALQADGWTLRSDIIWAKPNPMPESVTDRCTKSHEYLFLLTKNKRYYYDADAVREENPKYAEERILREREKGMNGEIKSKHADHVRLSTSSLFRRQVGARMLGRNRRTVWNIATAPYSGAHFATFPPALVEPCIKAGTSERGCCPVCGKQWVRVVEKETINRRDNGNGDDKIDYGMYSGRAGNTTSTTIGFRPDCDHDAEAVPCTVFDPFSGSGTTAMVANQLGRRGVGLDLSLDYIELAKERTGLAALEAWINGIDATEDVDLGPLFDL